MFQSWNQGRLNNNLVKYSGQGGSGTNCLDDNPISAHGGGWVILVATVSVRTLTVKKKRYFSGKNHQNTRAASKNFKIL